jgi:hypothetical protein
MFSLAEKDFVGAQQRPAETYMLAQVIQSRRR